MILWLEICTDQVTEESKECFLKYLELQDSLCQGKKHDHDHDNINGNDIGNDNDNGNYHNHDF